MISRVLTLLFALPLLAAAQSSPQPPGRRYIIRAAHMIDGRSDVVQNDVAVIIDGERIASVGLANVQSPPKYQMSITRMIKLLPRLAHLCAGFSLTHQPGRTGPTRRA